MRLCNSLSVAAAACAALCLSFASAFADTSDYGRKDAAAPQAASQRVADGAFKALRTRCETEVASGKTSGDVCAEAAALIVGDNVAEEWRDISETQRIKIALRLLERGVDTSNLARGRAYDFYSRSEIINFGGYADSYRARELMEMMIKSGYPGGILRQARANVGILSFGSDAEKKEYCVLARKMLGAGDLDVDSIQLAKDVLSAGACTETIIK